MDFFSFVEAYIFICYSVSYKLVLMSAYLKFGEKLMAFVVDFSLDLLYFSSFLLFWLFHFDRKTIKFYFLLLKVLFGFLFLFTFLDLVWSFVLLFF